MEKQMQTTVPVQIGVKGRTSNWMGMTRVIVWHGKAVDN